MFQKITDWYEHRPMGRRIAELVALSIFLMSIIASALYANSVTSRAQDDYDSSVARQATAARRNLMSNIESYNYLLLSAAALINQKGDISRDEWNRFYGDMTRSGSLPALLGVGYTQRVVSQEQLEGFYQKLTNEGQAGVAYRAESEYKDAPYSTITYLAPETSVNQRALGYDMYSESSRREAMQTARDQAKIAMSAPVILKQSDGNNAPQFGVLIYYPIYEGGVIPETVSERQAKHTGYVYVATQPNSFITEYLKNTEVLTSDSQLMAYDKAAGESKLLYKSADFDKSNHSRATTIARDVELDTRTWVAVVRGYYTGPTIFAEPWVIIALGSLIGALVGVIIYRFLFHRLSKVEAKYESEVQQSKDELLALASHQLRTPASGVKQYIGMLTSGIMGELTPEQKNIAEKAFETNERQLQIINELLYVSKIDAGQLVIEPRQINMTKLVTRAIDDSLEAASHKNITIAFRRKRPLEITADDRYISMVVENLISNAIKYSYPSSTVTVRLEEHANAVTVAVKDQGVGIPENKFKQLFGKFNRIDNPLSYTEGGSGLGLFLALQLARAHGGDITVESKIDKGSTFTLTLPKSLTIDSTIVNLTNIPGGPDE